MFLVVGVIIVFVGLFIGITLWGSGGGTAGNTGH
jgi:hypothetical protein